MSAPPGSRARIGILGRPYGLLTSAKSGSASLSSNSVTTATAYKIGYAVANLSCNVTITASAYKTKPATSSVSSNSTVTASAYKVKPASSSISCNAAVTASAIKITPVVKFGDSTSSGRGQVTATPPARTRLAFAGIEGHGVVTATGTNVKLTSANLSAKAVITSTAYSVNVAAATLTSNGTITAAPYVQKIAQSLLSAKAQLSASATKNGAVSGIGYLSGYSNITAVAYKQKLLTSNVSGNALITSTANRTKLAVANLSSNATVTATAVTTSVKTATANISANITITASVTKSTSKSATASLTGRGQIQATGSRQLFASIYGRSVITAVASNSNARVAISGYSNITARASAKTAFSQISCYAQITATVVRSRTYTVDVSLISRAIIIAIATPPAHGCECPPWIVSDNDTCNWINPQIILGQGYSDLPYTLPIFRLKSLTTAVNRAYTLRTQTCTPYVYSPSQSNTYLYQSTINYSWVNQNTNYVAWSYASSLSSAYNRFLTQNRNTPYTLIIFRLHYPLGSSAGLCSYTRSLIPQLSYSVESSQQNVYNVSVNNAGTYVRKGCD